MTELTRRDFIKGVAASGIVAAASLFASRGGASAKSSCAPAPPGENMPFILRIPGAHVALADKNGKLLRQPDLKQAPGFINVAGRKISSAQALDGLWGYISASGEWIVEPQFEIAKSFSGDGLARCRKGGRWGYIAPGGDMRIPLQFDDAEGFHNGLAAIRIGEKWGYVDLNGAVVIEPQFQSAAPFSSPGLAAVQSGERWGYIDRTGAAIISPRFIAAGSFGEEGVAPAASGRDVLWSEWGLIDPDGRWILSPKHLTIKDFNEFGLAHFKSQDASVSGFLNAKGVEVIAVRGGDASVMNCGLTRSSVTRGGFFNAEGTLAIPEQFDWVSHFGPAAAAIGRRKGVWGVVQPDGRFIPSSRVEPCTTRDRRVLGFGHSGLAPWLAADGAVEWLDREAQVWFRAALSDARIVLSNASGETIWKSEAGEDRRVMQELVLEIGPEQVFHDPAAWKGDIAQVAQKLLREPPRRFAPCRRVLHEQRDVYDLSALDEDEIEERARMGAMAALANFYAGETEYGEYAFWAHQQSDLFQNLFAALRDRLKAAFGEPQADTERRFNIGGAGVEASWRVNDAELILCWLTEYGDGDFENQILLAALRDKA